MDTMHRIFDHKKFDNVYNSLIEHGQWNEVPKYYSIYKKRYRTLIKLYSQITSNDKKQKILDIGGGQYALLCERIWQDEAFLADVNDTNFNNLNSLGVHTFKWNLAVEDLELKEKFDVIFFSEVIEHLPVPGHIVLKKLKKLIKPGGYLICTTPNLYRIRNVIFLITGKPIFDYFRFSDNSMGHMLEYSKDHIEWQLSPGQSYLID